MINLIQPKVEKISWSPKGLRNAMTDWLNMPHPAERIIPSWPAELLMGFALLSPGVIVYLN
jgi:hypothetical protein